MSIKPGKIEKNNEEEDDEEELNLEKQGDEANQDDDFDFKEKAKAQAQAGGNNDEKTQVIQNNHFDEALNLSDNGSDEYNSGEENNQQKENEESGNKNEVVKNEQKRPGNAKAEALQKKEDLDSGDEEGKKNIKIEGLYNPADYASLNVGTEITELFKYITRYKPQQVEIDTKLKAFIPDYIPAVGEVDAFLKMVRPDNQNETLGLSTLDEPTLNQSKKSKLDLEFTNLMKRNKDGKNVIIHSIETADKNPKEIMTWINDVAEIHKKKQPPSVSYSKNMPDIDSLMQVWPVEIEDALQELMTPSEEIDFSLADYAKLACVLLDIPVHSVNNNKNVVESLHVLFTLFSEFKANQHFQQQQKAEGFENDQQGMEIN